MPNNPDILIMLDEQLAATEMRVATEGNPERVMRWIQAHGELIEFRAQVAARHTPVAQGAHETPIGEVSTVVYALLRYHEDRAESITFPYVFTEVDHRRAAETLASLHARLKR